MNSTPSIALAIEIIDPLPYYDYAHVCVYTFAYDDDYAVDFPFYHESQWVSQFYSGLTRSWVAKYLDFRNTWLLLVLRRHGIKSTCLTREIFSFVGVPVSIEWGVTVQLLDPVYFVPYDDTVHQREFMGEHGFRCNCSDCYLTFGSTRQTIQEMVYSGLGPFARPRSWQPPPLAPSGVPGTWSPEKNDWVWAKGTYYTREQYIEYLKQKYPSIFPERILLLCRREGYTD